MTKKQIEENAKINHEMELITAEIKAANKIANNCNLEDTIESISTDYRNRDSLRFQIEYLQKINDELCKKNQAAYREYTAALTNILDNYTPLGIAMRLDAVEKGSSND